MKKLISLFVVLFSSFVVFAYSGTVYSAWNNPYSVESGHEDNTLYSAFTERPKFLDPVRSYSENEYRFLGNIYEPPLQYHYLHRPYKLTPQTLTTLPEAIYLDKLGNPLEDQNNIDQIAYTEYRFELQKGILYQPHPALAKDEQGHYYYHTLSASETQSITSLDQLEHQGTRELVAADYVHQIKRIAYPKLHSPIRGLMHEYIVGLKELTEQLQTASKAAKGKRIDLRDYAIEGITITNDYQFSIRVNGQYPQFVYWLAMPFFSPIPWEADVFYDQPGFAENNISLHWYPIGTGAYMLTENNPNLRMSLEKNPNFRGQIYPSTGEVEDQKKGLLDDAGKTIPFIDKVVFTLEKESIPYWNKFLQGYFDSSGISSDSFDSAISFSGGNISLTDDMKNKGIKLNTVVDTSIFYLGFNMMDSVIGGHSERSRLLRQAISIAIDYEEYISIFSNGRAIAGQSPIPPGIFGYQEGESGINPYVYDWVNGKPKRKSIDTAKTLLEKAGYSNGIDQETSKPLILYYEAVGSGPSSKSRLNWFRKQLKKLNIQLIIRSTDYNRFLEKMNKGNAQLFGFGWNADYPDPENFLFLLYGPQGKVTHKGQNYVNYSNAEYDRLFEKMRNMVNSPERQIIINQMVEIIRRDAPWIFSFHPKSFSLQHNWYKNTKPFVMTNTGTLKYRRLEVEERNQAREVWNQPVIWPVALIIFILIGLLIPAVVAYRRHERSRIL